MLLLALFCGCSCCLTFNVLCGHVTSRSCMCCGVLFQVVLWGDSSSGVVCCVTSSGVVCCVAISSSGVVWHVASSSVVCCVISL